MESSNWQCEADQNGANKNGLKSLGDNYRRLLTIDNTTGGGYRMMDSTTDTGERSESSASYASLSSIVNDQRQDSPESNMANQEAALLHEACKYGNLAEVKRITNEGGTYINSRGIRGNTPVMVAAKNGHMDIVQHLLSKGCQLKMVNDFGNNLLHVSCVGGNVEIITRILSLGIFDMEERGRYNWTPIMVAANFGQLELFHFLVSKGCNLSLSDEHGYNMLHIACLGGSVEMANHIISLGIIDVESRGYDMMTPLLTAVAYGHFMVFKNLYDKKCNVLAVDKFNNTALHVACRIGNLGVVKDIVSLGVIDIECPGYLGRTPLLTAAEYGNIDVFSFLLNQGCNVSAVDEVKNTVLHIACLKDNQIHMVKHLLTMTVVKAMTLNVNKHFDTPAEIAKTKEIIKMISSVSCRQIEY